MRPSPEQLALIRAAAPAKGDFTRFGEALQVDADDVTVICTYGGLVYVGSVTAEGSPMLQPWYYRDQAAKQLEGVTPERREAIKIAAASTATSDKLRAAR